MKVKDTKDEGFYSPTIIYTMMEEQMMEESRRKYPEAWAYFNGILEDRIKLSGERQVRD